VAPRVPARSDPIAGILWRIGKRKLTRRPILGRAFPEGIV
jgi:hypothetical protein